MWKRQIVRQRLEREPSHLADLAAVGSRLTGLYASSVHNQDHGVVEFGVHAHEPLQADDDAHLLEHLAHRGLLEHLAAIDVAGREAPLVLARIDAAAAQQHPAGVSQDDRHRDLRIEVVDEPAAADTSAARDPRERQARAATRNAGSSPGVLVVRMSLSGRQFGVGIELEQARVVFGPIDVADQIGIVEMHSFDGLGVRPQVLRAADVAFLDHQRREQRARDEHRHAAHPAGLGHGRRPSADLLASCELAQRFRCHQRHVRWIDEHPARLGCDRRQSTPQ